MNQKNTRELQYNYAYINEIGYCVTAMTFSYEINDPNWIPIGPNYDDWMYKYYNRADGKWYHDAAFTQEATELN